MDNSHRATDRRQNFSKVSQAVVNKEHVHNQTGGKGGNKSFPNSRLIIASLGLLNAVLLITAAVIGLQCLTTIQKDRKHQDSKDMDLHSPAKISASPNTSETSCSISLELSLHPGAKVKEGSIEVSHSVAAELIEDLNVLRSNHSDVIKAEEEAKKELKLTLKNHVQLKQQIKHQQGASDKLQKQLETLLAEKANLKSNMSTFENSCGRCLPGWILLNSSCGYFSVQDSSNVKKTWPDSRADCISRGADLIVIDTPAKQSLVSNTIRGLGSNDYQSHSDLIFWIGLTYMTSRWVWVNNVTEDDRRFWNSNFMDTSQPLCASTFYNNRNPWFTRMPTHCQSFSYPWICEMMLK